MPSQDDGITDDQLDAILSRFTAATTGKWEAHTATGYIDGRKESVEYFVMREGDDVAITSDCSDPATGKPHKPNAEFIAAAHDSMGTLVAEVRLRRSGLARLTGPELDRLDEITRAATPGPWRTQRVQGGDDPWSVVRDNDDDDLAGAVCLDCLRPESAEPDEANAEFIAHAREDVPLLIAECRRLAMVTP